MDSQVRGGRAFRISLATASSLVAFGVWFARANKDGCWLFWHGVWTTIAVYSAIWIWLALFLFFRLRGRITLIGLSLLVAVIWPTHFNYVATAESSAVGRLRSMQSELSQHEYPKTLAKSGTPQGKHDAFDFTYMPEYSSDGSVVSYVIQAVPLHRSCGCVRSFTVTDKGDVHYTSESRAANHSDPLLAQFGTTPD